MWEGTVFAGAGKAFYIQMGTAWRGF